MSLSMTINKPRNYVWALWSKYIEFALDLASYVCSMPNYIEFFVFFFFFCFLCPKKSCTSGIVNDLLDYYVDQFQISMGYFSLVFIQLTSNLGTMILCIELLCYDFWITMWIDVAPLIL